MTIRTKRAYDEPAPRDGRRILVDRLWPRGLGRRDAAIDYWAKSIAPSDALRRWYRHDPEKWPEFKRRYRKELEANQSAVAELHAQLGRGPVTLLYGSREGRLNNAAVLKEFLESRTRRRSRGRGR